MPSLEEIRRKKLQELLKKQQAAETANNVDSQADAFAQIEQLVRRYLDADAQQRLSNIKLVNPEFAMQIVYFLYQLIGAGRLTKVLNDKEFKALLEQLAPKKREPKIVRK